MTVNYSITFGLPLDNTCLGILNACRQVYKDDKGEYTWYADSFDQSGNISFSKKYL